MRSGRYVIVLEIVLGGCLVNGSTYYSLLEEDVEARLQAQGNGRTMRIFGILGGKINNKREVVLVMDLWIDR